MVTMVTMATMATLVTILVAVSPPRISHIFEISPYWSNEAQLNQIADRDPPSAATRRTRYKTRFGHLCLAQVL
jgi:hypothetical protein